MPIRVVESFDVVDFVSVRRKALSGNDNGAPGSFVAGFEGKGYAMGIANTGLGSDHLRRYAMPNFSTATVMFNLRRRNITGGAPGTFNYNSPYFIQFRDEFDAVMFGIRLEANGSITLTDGGTGPGYYNSTVFVPLCDFGSANTDFAHMTLRLTTPNGIEFYIGGVPVFTDFVFPTGSLPIRYIVGCHNQFGQDSLDLDNFICTDTEVFGQTYIVGSVPVGDITISGFFRVGAGVYYKCVNESIYNADTAVDYASYIQASIGGEKALFRFSNVGAYSGIKAVVLTVHCLNTSHLATTPGQVQIVMQRDSVEQLSTPQNVPTKLLSGDTDSVSARGLQFIMETDPYTGLAWLPADISNTYFGVKLFTGPDVGVTKIYQIHREIVCASLIGGYGAALDDWSMRTPVWAQG